MTRQLAAALTITLFAVSTAAAQDARDTLERTTRRGDRLTIDLRSQDPIEGRLLTAGADVLTIESSGGPVAIPYSDLERVRRRRNGFGTGRHHRSRHGRDVRHPSENYRERRKR